MQHKLLEQKQLLAQALLKSETGAVFICGSTRMGKDVSQALVSVLA